MAVSKSTVMILVNMGRWRKFKMLAESEILKKEEKWDRYFSEISRPKLIEGTLRRLNFDGDEDSSDLDLYDYLNDALFTVLNNDWELHGSDINCVEKTDDLVQSMAESLTTNEKNIFYGRTPLFDRNKQKAILEKVLDEQGMRKIKSIQESREKAPTGTYEAENSVTDRTAPLATQKASTGPGKVHMVSVFRRKTTTVPKKRKNPSQSAGDHNNKIPRRASP